MNLHLRSVSPGEKVANSKSAMRGEDRTNGYGLINGMGLTNGNGLINGNGFTNGISKLSVGRNTFGIVTNKDLRLGLAIVMLGILIIPVVSIFLMEPRYEEVLPSVTIDGEFSDWQDVPAYVDDSDVRNAEVNIQSYAVDIERTYLSFYVQSVGIILGDVTGYDSWYFFLDRDGESSTGYLIRNFGADFVVHVYGGENTVSEAELLSFEGNDQYNWSAFSRVRNVEAKASGRAMEVQLGTRALDLQDNFLVLFCADDQEGIQSCSSVPVGKDAGSLLVEQRGIKEIVARDVEDIMELRFTAKGGDVVVEDVTVKIDGDGSTIPIEAPFTVEKGESVTKLIRADLSSSALGSLVDASVESLTADRPYSIRGSPARFYVEEIPQGITIDGFFGDWAESKLDSIDPHLPPNTDIAEYDAEKGLLDAYFYLRVSGEILEGSIVPERRVKAIEGGPSELTPPSEQIKQRAVGEDYAMIYIDSNTSDDLGEEFFGIRASTIIEIRGKYGVIRQTILKQWSEGGWEEVAGLSCAKDYDELECSVVLGRLGSLDSPEILFLVSTWWKKGDFAVQQEDWRTRSRAIYLLEQDGAGGHVGLSLQRKLFYSSPYFFAFYYDAVEDNIVWEWSEDGIDWTHTASTVFGTSNIYYASIWYNSSDSYVYIVGAKESSDNVVYTRRGSVSGNSISWGTEYSVSMSDAAGAKRVASIAVSTEGYVWIASEVYNDTGWNVNVTRSQSPESLSSFGTRTPLVPTDRSERIGPVIVPLSGNDMYCVYNINGDIYGNKYDGTGESWASEETVATDGLGREKGGPSIVVDDSQNIHLVYANDAGKVKYTKYTTSWGAATILDEDTTKYYPTISLLNPDDLYALWVNVSGSSYQISGKHSTNGGSSWSWFELISPDTDYKGNLTSIYSYPEDWGICWMWDENKDDKDFYFERIPEYELVIVPVLIAVAIPVVLRKKRRD